MYFTKLPDHSSPGFDEQHHFNLFQQHNIIFNAKANKSICEDHVGCLSLKTVFDEEEWYTIDKIPFAVRPQQYLILNQDQNYGSRIDSNYPVSTFSIFFQPDFASSILYDTTNSETKLLDEPMVTGSRLEFFQKLHYADDSIQNSIANLISSLNSFGYSKTGTEEKLVSILQQLVQVHYNESKNFIKVEALKSSTRAEIYKRVCVAKDVIHSYYSSDINLQTISRFACMSVPQLLRQFKSVFNVTPHQYLTAVRLKNACHLLQHSQLSVSDIVTASGFQDVSAFTRLFKLNYTYSPLVYRKLFKN